MSERVPVPDPIRQRAGHLGGHASWANTPDRAARTAKPRAAGPNSVEWHLARLDPERFANATDRQKLQAAESARMAWFARLAMTSAQSRARKKAANRASA